MKLSTQIESPRAGEQPQPVGASDEPRPANPHAKRPFVEPEVSAPVEVLAATTFFQAATSGGTN